jgi:hypothetical protein
MDSFLSNSFLGWWHSALLAFYDSLTRDDAGQPADLIFVMAGRMERKQFGLELFRAGISPRLVLSVGRFEVRKMRSLGLEGFDELIMLRDQTRPEERHFFMNVDASGVRIERARLPLCNTYGEALGFRRYLEQVKVRRVIVVSTDVHLRRVSLSFAKVFRGEPVEFIYRPVPSCLSSVRKEGWWSRPNDRRFVLLEALKLAGYSVILCLPSKFSRRIMQLHG